MPTKNLGGFISVEEVCCVAVTMRRTQSATRPLAAFQVHRSFANFGRDEAGWVVGGVQTRLGCIDWVVDTHVQLLMVVLGTSSESLQP